MKDFTVTLPADDVKVLIRENDPDDAIAILKETYERAFRMYLSELTVQELYAIFMEGGDYDEDS